MGGFAAYNVGLKHRDRFGVLVGILPALDIRYADCHDNYMADYDPNCHVYRETMRPHRVVGRFYGVIAVHEHRFTDPTVGRRNPAGMAIFARNNPVELLAALDIRPGEFEMFIGYSKQDEFNLDAQAEHFVDEAARRGIRPAVVCLPDGKHDSESGVRFLPVFGPWLMRKLAPYVSHAGVPRATCSDLLTTRPRLGLFRKPKADPVWVQTDEPWSPAPAAGSTTPP
jgi:S-formylglutathione hydrolase FrmB